MKRSRLAVLSAIIIMAALSASEGMAAKSTLSITDDRGQVLQLRSIPRRVISLAPSVTEILFRIGAAPQVIGVTNYCNYPPAVSGVARVGDMNLDYEAMLALKPDLVVALSGLQPSTIDRLKQLGLPVLVLSPRGIDDVPRHMRLLGKATGRSEMAAKAAQEFERRVNAVRAKTARASIRPRVFVEIWNEPLMTAGPGTYIQELIIAAGGSNIAADASGEWPQFSHEAVIQRNPEVIILTCYNKAETLKRKAWQGLSAIKTGRVFEINPDVYVRPGPRLADALEELAAILHPEIFR